MTADKTLVAGAIKEAREKAGLTQKELGALIGRKERTIQRWESGEGDPGKAHQSAIREATLLRVPASSATEASISALQKSATLSDTGTGGPSFHSPEERVRAVTEEEYGNGKGGGLVHIPLAEVEVSAGPGGEVWSEQPGSFVTMSRTYARNLTGVRPDRLMIMVASGSSMAPVIMPGDRLLIAKHEGAPIVDGRIYIFRNRYAGLMVKRAFWKDSVLVIMGENDDEPVAKIVPNDEAPEWSVIGAVLRVEKPL